jgi:hypothetical protein
MLALSSKHAILESLRQQVAATQLPVAPLFSTGCYALDCILPAGSLHRGTLLEFLSDSGSGAAALATIVGREAVKDGGAFVVVDRERSVYPPAAANLGIGADTIFLHPRTQKDHLWALNQSLGCQGVGAVLCWPNRLSDRGFRSLQLAAERGGAVGLMMRPRAVRGHPTWSELQLLVEPLCTARTSRRLRVTVIRSRNGQAGAWVELEIDDETGTINESRSMPVAAAVATAAHRNRKAGA